ncbi:MAG: hypothetical protein J2P46_05025 [Zavarzinella sp.]|nr:hypothetical protein [Zavarzinella sp.]
MNRVLWASGLSVVVLAAGGALFVRGGVGPESPNRPGPEAANPPAAAARPADPVPVAAAPKPGGIPKEADAERAQLLETVGCLTAAHYFQTYLNIGFIAEGKARGTYTDADARKVLDSVLSILNSTDAKLEALGKIDLDKDDRERLEQLRAASALLRQQGKELQTYWETGKDENAAKYESLRKNAWATISKLLGIGQ